MTQSADLITSTEAGAILGRSGRTVQRMTAKGQLKAVMKLPGPNGPVLYRRSDVEKLAQKLLAAGGAA